MTSNLLSTVQKRIRDEMNEQADHVAGGGCLSAESAEMVAVKYAKHVGLIEGLALAERCILDVIEEFSEQETLDL